MEARFNFPALGTVFEIVIWDKLPAAKFELLKQKILVESEKFDNTYSRFIPDSLICKLANKTGRLEVPGDLVRMLRIYKKLYRLTNKKLNPLIGFSLSDLGYDANYSLRKHSQVRQTPSLEKTLKIVDDLRIDLKDSVLIDLGALGKGFFVDKLVDCLVHMGLTDFWLMAAEMFFTKMPIPGKY